MEFIPVNEPLLDGNEKRYLAECIDTGWISSEGPFVERLETGLANLTGRKHAIAVCNGSAALDLAIASLGLGAGDEVILPSFTIISCASAIVRAGATPVLVDSDAETWNMDVTQVEARITARTRAIMVVHLYGLPVDMDPILKLAARHGLKVIEDAAEAIGQRYKEKPCGSFGDISTMSFYANKHLTTGEGGMVLTNCPHLAEKCRSLRNLCFTSNRFVHEEIGWNFRMSNLQAAVGVAQLEKLDRTLDRKLQIGLLYHELLSSASVNLRLPVKDTGFATNDYWVFGVVIESKVPDAREAMLRLHSLGVGTRPFFWPMHQQPVFERLGLFQGERYPVSECLSRRGFYLPGGIALDDSMVARAASACLKVCG